MLRKGFSILAVVALAAPLFGAEVARVVKTYETGTIRPVGPNTACSGDQFVNVEGVNNGDFASYAVIRFDANDVRAEFDATFGAGDWSVSGVELRLVQTGASFALDGFLDLFYSTDDLTDCKTSSSPLKHPFTEGGVDDLPVEFVTQQFFAVGAAGDVDAYDLSGSASLLADLSPGGDGVATIVIVEGDPDVATSHRGQNPFNDRTNGINYLAAQILVTATGNVNAATTIAVEASADETGTIQGAGPRGPCNGDRFFNVEGANNGTFASYGVLRFNTADLRNALDSAYGAGQWSVTNVSLELVQEIAAFSLDGFVDYYYSPDDAVDCKTTNGGLTYPLFENSIPDLTVEFITQQFWAIGATGDVDTIDLSGSASLASDIESDTAVTLVINEGDPDVAATWRGQAPFGLVRRAPRLVVTAQGGGGGGDCESDACNGNERLKTKTKARGCGCQAKITVLDATPGAVYGVVTPNGDCVRKAANSRGKVVVKECPSRDGTASVPTCGLSKDVDCP